MALMYILKFLKNKKTLLIRITKIYTHLARLAIRYLSAPPSLFFLKGYSQKLITCTNKGEIDYFQKPAKNVISTLQHK